VLQKLLKPCSGFQKLALAQTAQAIPVAVEPSGELSLPSIRFGACIERFSVRHKPPRN
jgi:hypothetical protein